MNKYVIRNNDLPGDTVSINAEPGMKLPNGKETSGEFVVNSNATAAFGPMLEYMNNAVPRHYSKNNFALGQEGKAHESINMLMVKSTLANMLPSENVPQKIEANEFASLPIADSPVRQRVDATRNMQKGGEVDFKEHMMYDKNDKGYLAKTYEDHLRMKEMGYSHKGMQEGGEVRSPTMGDIGALLRLEELYKSGDPKVESGASAFTPEGGYSKDYFAEEMGIPMESFDIDTVSYSNPANYEFNFLKDGEKAGTQRSRGNMPPRSAEYSRQKHTAEQALRKEIGDDNYGDVIMDMFKKDYTGLEDKISSKYYDMSSEEQANYDMDKIRSRFRSRNFQEGGEVGKYEKALQKAEMMGDAGYALPESLSAPAEEMSNMRSAEDLYGMYMRMGPQMVKDKMSDMESRALDSLLQQKMNNMDRPAVPQYGMGGMIDEYNMGGYVKKYQDGGEVLDLNSNNLKSSGVLEMLRLANAGTGVKPERLEQLNPERQIKKRESIFNRPDSNEYNMPTFQGDSGAFKTPVMRAPSDSYGGNEIKKNLNVIIPYLQSQGKMKTPMQEKIEFLYNRLNVDPNNPPSSLQGLKGSALLQRLGNEGI